MLLRYPAAPFTLRSSNILVIIIILVISVIPSMTLVNISRNVLMTVDIRTQMSAFTVNIFINSAIVLLIGIYS